MADLLLSNRRPFQSEDWGKFVHHLHCILFQMNANKNVPGINSVRLTRVSSTKKKANQRHSYLKKLESKI
jgi:hypothetical protein